jgi:hypothetical protein
MFGIFGWIRAQAKQAILAGVADAADEMEAELPGFDAEAWRKKFAAPPKALPAAEDEGDDRPRKRRGA